MPGVPVTASEAHAVRSRLGSASDGEEMGRSSATLVVVAANMGIGS